MAGVTLETVTKDFRTQGGVVRAVSDITLDVADREFVVVVGPSGCGKTTTLRLIAGLEEVTAGTIRIGGSVVNGVAPRDRNVAMVFQNYALYPHMTVFKNMAFGLKMRRVPKPEISRKVREVAELLGIADLLGRKPGALSGGQRQRVALGRAIVRNPAVFLFDEPLANLDAGLRTRMRTFLKSLHHELHTTVIHVTHDQEEAMTLGDRIVVLREGRVQQCGPPLAVYDRPVNRFVAGFIGNPPMNFLFGRLDAHHDRLSWIAANTFLPLPADVADRLKAPATGPVVLGIRPEHLVLDDGSGARLVSDAAAPACALPACAADADRHADKAATPLAPLAEATIRLVEPIGNAIHVQCQIGASATGQVGMSAGSILNGVRLTARLLPTAVPSIHQRVRLLVDLSRVHLFRGDEAGERLN